MYPTQDGHRVTVDMCHVTVTVLLDYLYTCALPEELPVLVWEELTIAQHKYGLVQLVYFIQSYFSPRFILESKSPLHQA